MIGTKTAAIFLFPLLVLSFSGSSSANVIESSSVEQDYDSMILSTLFQAQEFYRQEDDQERPFLRMGNMDFFPSHNISICNVVDMNVYTNIIGGATSSSLDDNGGGARRRVPYQYPFGVQAAATIALAMEHLNSGNGDIVRQVQGLNETCNIRFVPEYLDTALQAREIVGPLTQVMERTQQAPCAFSGATFSVISVTTAILTDSIGGYPQLSALSASPELDDKRRFPRFGRLRPTAEDVGPIALDFLYHQYNVRNLGIFHETNELSLSFLRSLQRSVDADYGDVKLYPIGFNGQLDSDGNLVELQARITLLKEFDLRFFFLIGRNDFYDAILEEAVAQGIAGTGFHNWIAVEEDASWQQRELPASSPLLLSLTGLTKISNAGSRPGVGRYNMFYEHFKRLGDNTADLVFLESMLPTYDNDNDDELPYTNVLNASMFSIESEYLPFYYDLIILMGLAACSAVGANSEDQQQSLMGSAHYQAILHTSFQGASGNVLLKPSTGSRDPTTSFFGADNFIPMKNDDGNFTFVRKKIAVYQEGKWEILEKPIFNDNTSHIPQDLPHLRLDEKNIGPGLRSVGYALSGIVMITAGCMASWTFFNQKSRVIRASQPLFLHLICFGSFLMGLSIIPLGIDDTLSEDPSLACFGYPSLVMLGWCFAFTALYSKSRQVNKVFHKPSFKRVVIRKVDVLRPMSLLVVVNIAILVVWFVTSPHRWKRHVVALDNFSRATETLGRCESEHGGIFWASLLIVDSLVLLFAMQQAFVARKIATEFSESEYIARAMSIIFVVGLVACPVMLLAKDSPQALFFVKAVLATVVGLSLLLFIFVPKIIYFEKYGSSQYDFAVQQTLNRLADARVQCSDEEPEEEEHSELVGPRVIDHPKLRQWNGIEQTESVDIAPTSGERKPMSQHKSSCAWWHS